MNVAARTGSGAMEASRKLLTICTSLLISDIAKTPDSKNSRLTLTPLHGASRLVLARKTLPNLAKSPV
jgi:hypothetical protein